MKFKKQTTTYNISRLEVENLIAKKRLGKTKSVYYQVWDDDICYGNITKGYNGHLWEFVPVCNDTGGVDALGLSSEQLIEIAEEMDELNAKIIR